MNETKDPTPRLLILGSAAAEGIPALFCDCPVCRAAHALGPAGRRMRTSYNFGGEVQIDFGPDSLQAWQAHYDVMRRMRHVIVTHAHEDHFQPTDFLYKDHGFARIPAIDAILTIHGTAPTLARFEAETCGFFGGTLAERLAKADIALHEFKQFDTFELDGTGAIVRSFAANHAPRLDPCVFLVTLRGRTAFICNDTGCLPDASWDALAKLRGEVAIDVAVIDDTGMLIGTPGHGDDAWENGHMSAPTVLRTLDRLDSLGLLAPDCIRAVNHFSHNGGSTNEELEAFYAPRGIIVGRDGLIL